MKKLPYNATYRNSDVTIYTENDRAVFEVDGWYDDSLGIGEMIIGSTFIVQ